MTVAPHIGFSALGLRLSVAIERKCTLRHRKIRSSDSGRLGVELKGKQQLLQIKTRIEIPGLAVIFGRILLKQAIAEMFVFCGFGRIE